MLLPAYEPSEAQVGAAAEALGLPLQWTLPFGLGTMAMFRADDQFGVLVYWDEGTPEGRAFRPVCPPGVPFAEQARMAKAEVERLRNEAID